MQQGGRVQPEFKGRYEVTLGGMLDGKPWILSPTLAKTLQVRQYQRIDGMVEYPLKAKVNLVQVKVVDEQGLIRATQSVKL